VADCPKCSSDLGLKTSFALANFWNPGGLGRYFVPPKLEFPCHRCGTVLTYRADVAGLFAILALVPFLGTFLLQTLGYWAFLLGAVAFVAYLVGLAIFFSRYAQPMVADPRLED
jgi:hypothetical protein